MKWLGCLASISLLMGCGGGSNGDSEGAGGGGASGSGAGAAAGASGSGAGGAATGGSAGSGGEVGVGTVEVDLPIDFSGIDVVWEPCPLFELPAPSGQADCANVTVPLLWNDDPRTLMLRVKRRRSDTQPATAQLWFMAGGPGAAGATVHAPLMDLWGSTASIAVDTYSIDHRGTGGSALLDCPGVQDAGSDGGGGLVLSEIPDCVSHLQTTLGDDLLGYAETYSAIDLRALIETERQAGQSVFLWGGSGGTILGQRFLQLFPDAVDGVILEAINSADRTIVDWATAHDESMRNLLDLNCRSDATCNARIGPDPFDTYQTLLDDLEAGSCAAVTDVYGADRVERVLAREMLTNGSRLMLIPALIDRLRRCTSEDATVFANVAGPVDSPGSDPAQLSWTLLRHISFSELIFNDTFPTEAEITAYRDAQRPLGRDLANTALEGRRLWAPVAYSDPTFDNGWADSAVPMLMMQGALDPATPAIFARRVGENFNRAGQQYVEFPNASHSFDSGVMVQGPSGPFNCRFALWLTFMTNAGQTLDTSCASRAEAVDFDPPASVVQPVFGVPDAWATP